MPEGDGAESTNAILRAGVGEGGDPPCWAQLVCPACGAVETDRHREGCPRAEGGDGPAARVGTPPSETAD